MTAPSLNSDALLRFARRGVSVGLVLLAVLIQAAESQAEIELSVLSYNVRGLPSLIARDQPRQRVKAIGSLARAYDVVLLQEVFEYHSHIRRRMEGSVGVAGNGMVRDARRLAARILLAPVSAVIPHFSVPYGAGLSTFVKSALMLPGDVARAPFGVCEGWWSSAHDCWASKGYLRVGIRTPEGAIVDVYSTHLDAGRGKRASKTRRRQLRMLADAIAEQSGNGAVIVGGDLNLLLEEPRDREVMTEFRERLKLRDSGAGLDLPLCQNRDYILYRSGRHARIGVAQAGAALEFVNGTRALSDHPAVYARFRVAAIPPDTAAVVAE
jgi:hypothetical protein